jgi:hypothetical protein
MHSHAIPRLLLVGFMFALAAAGTLRFSADASERTTWSDTTSEEDVLVQPCYGFNITTSYTADRTYQVVENYYNNQIFERQHVSFTGALGNASTGKSYAYDGEYTRTADIHDGTTAISNLLLRFEVGTPGQFTVELTKVEFDLADNPPAVVKAIVPHVLQRDLCSVFGSPAATYVGPTNISTNEPLQKLTPSQPSDIHTKNSAKDQAAAADDDMTNWAELDPCDSSPPGKPC